MTKIIEHKIKEAYNNGHSYKSIMHEFNVSYGTICGIIGKFKLAGRKLKIKLIGKNKAKCSRCHKIRPLSRFSVGHSTKKYYYSFCNTCHQGKRTIYYNTNIESRLKLIYTHLKSKAKKLNLKFFISFEEFKNIYNKQNNKCYYTGFTMTTKLGNGASKFAISVDQIIPGKGYTKDNIVFCTRFANSIKSNLSKQELRKWIKAIYQHIN